MRQLRNVNDRVWVKRNLLALLTNLYYFPYKFGKKKGIINEVTYLQVLYISYVSANYRNKFTFNCNMFGMSIGHVEASRCVFCCFTDMLYFNENKDNIGWLNKSRSRFF